MRKIREILRLAWQCGRSGREIAQACGISHTAVNDYLATARAAGLQPDQIESMSDLEVTQKLALHRDGHPSRRPEPDWSSIHREMQKPGVTMSLLWQEYKETHPEAWQRSQFCVHYRRWQKRMRLTMRQTHKAGEKMFADYAGQTIPVVNPGGGEIRQAQVFVAVLGASSYTFAEASWDQRLPNWLSSHVRAFEYFGGVPKAVVPDNLKSGVAKTCRYEPEINPGYAELARHYGCVVLPARVRKPRDKAKVEVGVQIVERWILAVLRNRTFFSLEEVNAAIAELLEQLNQRNFKKMPGSRKSLFEEIEKPALQPLPAIRYVPAEWKKARVNIDYHIELTQHYYSVPYALAGQEVEIRYTPTTVEIFFQHKRVASHRRSDLPRQHTTVSEHMPKSHREYGEWSPSRIIAWAQTSGEATACVVKTILDRREYPEQGYRSCLGILRLGRQYSSARLELACRRAVALGAYSYRSIQSILEKGLDSQPVPEERQQPVIQAHEYLRGKKYYSFN
jgi:transposase